MATRFLEAATLRSGQQAALGLDLKSMMDALDLRNAVLAGYDWTWAFDDATYARTAASLDNPDFAAVVLHSYRVRIGAVAGDPTLEPLEARLAERPRITVPTIALAGADDGVDPPSAPDKIARHFSDLRRQKVLPGVGHNLPQEASAEFADAVLQLTN